MMTLAKSSPKRKRKPPATPRKSNSRRTAKPSTPTARTCRYSPFPPWMHNTALCIHGGNGEYRHVLAVGVDGFAVRRELDLRGVAGGFRFRFGDDFASVIITFRAQVSRRVFHLPAQF